MTLNVLDFKELFFTLILLQISCFVNLKFKMKETKNGLIYITLKTHSKNKTDLNVNFPL